MIVASHEMDFASRVVHRVLLIDQGNVDTSSVAQRGHSDAVANSSGGPTRVGHIALPVASHFDVGLGACSACAQGWTPFAPTQVTSSSRVNAAPSGRSKEAALQA